MTYADGFNLRDRSLVTLGDIADAFDTIADVASMTEETAPDNAADFIPIYDASGGVWKKVKINKWLGSWANYTPTFSVQGSSPTWTSITSDCYYKDIDDLRVVILDAIGTTGGTSVSTLRATLPSAPSKDIRSGAGIQINGSLLGAVCFSSTNILTVARYDRANITLAANTGIRTIVAYYV